MNPLMLVLTVLAVLVVGAGAYFYWPRDESYSSRSRGGQLVGGAAASFGTGLKSASTSMDEEANDITGRKRAGSVLNSKAFGSVAKGGKSASVLTLQKSLKYAQWPIPPLAWRLVQLCAALFAMSLASLKLNGVLTVACGLVGLMITNGFLTWAVERRFKAFDADYPAFLLSVVGLLKTGMNAIGALDAAAKGLAETSLLRAEVEMMIERLRFGVSEDRSIGAFAEDVYHPEIELFVQALLLSRRVGGTLSDTLERLSKQVRKRQFFRSSAVAAVGLQRGSIWFILGILTALEVYMYFVYPQAVVGAWADPTGWQVWQYGILVIMVGMYWVRQVTKLKV